MQAKEKTIPADFRCHSICENCGACRRGQKAMLMEVQRIGDAAIGNKANVQLPERKALRTSIVFYGVPLILLVAGLAAGYFLPDLLKLPGNPAVYAVILGCGLAGLYFAVSLLNGWKRQGTGFKKTCKMAVRNEE